MIGPILMNGDFCCKKEWREFYGLAILFYLCRIKTQKSYIQKTIETETLNPKNENVIRFNYTKKTNIKPTKEKNIKLIKFISMALLFVLLAFAVFFVSSKLSSNNENELENTEIPPKPNIEHKKRNNGDRTEQSGVHQSPEKPSESSTPIKPNSGDQNSGNANSVNSSVPSKIQNSMPSPTSHSEGSTHTVANGHISSTVVSNHNTAPAVNLNSVVQHGDEVVSSDQQTALDTANSSKSKK